MSEIQKLDSSTGNFMVRMTYGKDLNYWRPLKEDEHPPVDERKLILEIQTEKKLPEQFFLDLAGLLHKYSRK